MAGHIASGRRFPSRRSSRRRAGESPGSRVRQALDALTSLAAAAGPVAAGAGAGVDLGNGFRSGRLDGAPGDRRDAALAALRALWPDRTERLGERTAVLRKTPVPAALIQRVEPEEAIALCDEVWAASAIRSNTGWVVHTFGVRCRHRGYLGGRRGVVPHRHPPQRPAQRGRREVQMSGRSAAGLSES